MKKIEYLNQLVQKFNKNAKVISMCYNGNGYKFYPYGYIWTDYSKDKKFVSIKFKNIDKKAAQKLLANLAKIYDMTNLDMWENNRWNVIEYVIRLRIEIPWEIQR